ncbi:L-asparaginase [Microbacterium sp. 8M]|nr:L-asparaginase [Microbacterium sp. 8M]
MRMTEPARSGGGLLTLDGSAPAGPLAILYTGGTFGMVPSSRGLVPNPRLRNEIEALMAVVRPRGRRAVDWTYSETAQAVDSAELDCDALGRLADQIREIIVRDDPRAVVVIHGSDTLAYSASFVAFALADLSTPIVFTGSQRPIGFEHTDATENFALAVASADGTDANGVHIAFGGRLLPAIRATKRSTESPQAFAAPRPLAGEPVGVDRRVATALRRAAGSPAPRTGLVKVVPGVNAAQLVAVMNECPTGIVLECYGSGTAPMASGGLGAAIRAATERDTVVLAVTQCEDGPVTLDRYAVGSALAEAGAIGAGDMTSEAALGKLGALARAGFTGAELRELLGRNLLGERRG